MEVYEVIATNLDLNDGYFCNVLFTNLQSAINYCEQTIEQKQVKAVVRDLEGISEEYEFKSLEFTPSVNRPAIYYRSQYGDYWCVIFVKKRIVQNETYSTLTNLIF